VAGLDRERLTAAAARSSSGWKASASRLRPERLARPAADQRTRWPARV